MSKFSASDAAFVGFRLVREHPKAVAVWVAVMTVLSIVSTVLTIRFAGPQLEAFMAVWGNRDAEPEEALKAMSGLTPLFLCNLPYVILLRAVMLAGINRMVSRPADDRSAYLRLGADELKQAAVVVAYNLLLFAVFMSGAILSSLFLAVGGLSSLLGLVAFVGSGCLMIYLAVRLSLASAMTFDTGVISLRKSLPLTKGLFAPLAGAYLLAMIMSVIVTLLSMIVVAAVGVIASGGFSEASSVFKSDTTSLASYFTPMGMVNTLFAGTISTLTTLIVYSPAAEIYRLLKAQPATVDGSV